MQKNNYVPTRRLANEANVLWKEGIFPEKFIAFFYSGLGLALALAGVMFTKKYLFYNHLIQKEQDSQ